MAMNVVGMELFVVAELVLLAAALPLSVIAALGFWDAPFGRLMRPLPLIFFTFLVMDAGNLLDVELSIWYFHGLASIGGLIAAYAAIQGALLLTERREV